MFYYSRHQTTYPFAIGIQDQQVCLGKLDQLMPLATICLSLLLVVDDSIASMTTWKGLHLLFHILDYGGDNVMDLSGMQRVIINIAQTERKTTNIVTSNYITIILC